MPIFYFDTDDGELGQLDDTGLEFSDFEAAKREAVRTMSELVRDHMPSFPPGRRMTMAVRDGHGAVFEIAVSISIRELRLIS